MGLNLSYDFAENYWKSTDSNFHHFLQETNDSQNKISSNEIELSSKLTDLTKKCELWSSGEWCRNSNEVTELMSLMTIYQFALLMHHMDENFPGVSFHFVMEARLNKDWQAGAILLDRLKLIGKANFLDKIFSSMRTRLIAALLE